MSHIQPKFKIIITSQDNTTIEYICMTRQDVSDILGIKISTIYNLQNEKRQPKFKHKHTQNLQSIKIERIKYDKPDKPKRNYNKKTIPHNAENMIDYIEAIKNKISTKL